MDDLDCFIEGYISYSRKNFIAQDAGDLADQFIDEVQTDLDWDTIRDEIEWAQGHC